MKTSDFTTSILVDQAPKEDHSAKLIQLDHHRAGAGASIGLTIGKR